MGEITDFVRMYIEDSDILPDFVNEVAGKLEDNIKQEAPYKEGRLRRSIRTDKRVNKTDAIIQGYWDESVAPHGIYVLAGTRPHTIVSKKGPGHYLNTPFGIFRIVEHPGTKPNDFLGRGLEQTVAMYR